MYRERVNGSREREETKRKGWKEKVNYSREREKGETERKG